MRNNSNRLLKRLMILFAGVMAVFGMSSCTKSFCTNQDKSNQLFAYYGNLYNSDVALSDVDSSTDNITTQNTHRVSLFNSLSESNNFSLPDKDFLAFMDTKATEEAEKQVGLWQNSELIANIESAEEAKAVSYHVAIYAGVDQDSEGRYSVAALWTNFDKWYEEAINDPSIGILKTPSAGWVTQLKSLANTAISTNYACISPEGRIFTQDGSAIYIEGKSWGQSFKDYGFFEGLLVYPLACLIHVISEIGASAWFELLAILVVTLLVRSATVVSTIFQGKSQARQAKIQPQLNALQKKYPNSQTDREQQQAMMMEQRQLMKKANVHPMLPLLLLIVQYPLFICVWSALQGSAALAGGSFFGLSLTTTAATCFTSFSTTPGAIIGIIFFIFMTITNILSSCTSMWFTNWRQKNFGNGPKQFNQDGTEMDPNKMGKTMAMVMMVFIVIMGWNLPVAMGIYWIIGALIAILQALLTEYIQTRSRHNLTANTGDGSDLAAVRRSAKHVNSKKPKDKNNSDKPLWR